MMKRSYSPRQIRSNAWLRATLLGMLSTFALLLSQNAQTQYAPRSYYYKNGCYVTTDTPQDIRMDLGNIVIQPDTKPGLIKRQTFNIQESYSLFCINQNSMIGELPGSEPATNSEQHVYKTNVPGIGIRLYRQSYNGIISTYYPHRLSSYDSPRGNAKLAAGYFIVEIFKLPGPTGAGTLKQGLYSTYWGDGTGPSKPILTSHVYANSIAIVNSTCSLDAGSRNIAVDLGEAPKYTFTGVGSTNNDRNFNIKVDCVGGNDSVWSQARGDVSLSFSYTPDPDTNASKGVIKNEANADRAQGIAVQLLDDRNGTPVTNGSNLYVGKLRADSATSFTVPMRAHFYQTKSQIAGGNVRSLATFNVVYQ